MPRRAATLKQRTLPTCLQSVLASIGFQPQAKCTKLKTPKGARSSQSKFGPQAALSPAPISMQFRWALLQSEHAALFFKFHISGSQDTTSVAQQSCRFFCRIFEILFGEKRSDQLEPIWTPLNGAFVLAQLQGNNVSIQLWLGSIRVFANLHFSKGVRIWFVSCYSTSLSVTTGDSVGQSTG